MEPKNLKIWAAWLHRLVWTFIGLSAVAYLVARLGLEAGPWLEVQDRHQSDGWVARLPSDIAMAMFLVALVNLAGVVRRIAGGELFGPPVTSALRRFSFWLFLSSLVSIIGPTLAGLVTSHTGADHLVRIVADLRDLFFLLASLVLYLVAAVIDRAASIDAELREIV